MIQVAQSALLQALGYAIINSLWQFALLWLIYMLANSFIKLTSHQRYVGSVLLQFTGFCWFIGTVVFYYGESAKNIVEGYQYSQYSYLAYSGSSLSFKEMFFSMLLRGEMLLPYLSLAYFILITCFAVKIVKAYRHTQVLRHEGLQKIDVNWRLFVKHISGQLGIKQSVRLYISSLIESPVTIGYLKPIILMPIAVVNNLSTKQIEAILIHELAHIKRYDYLFNIFISGIEVCLFFNPFMQLLSKQMKRERENSCDDWVLQYEYNACTYAKALLQIATYKTTKTASFAVNAVDNKRALLIRVKRMIEKKDLYQTYRHQIASLLLVTLLISCLAWFTPRQYKGNKGAMQVSPIQPPKSIMEKVENPFFNPVFFLAEKENPPAIGNPLPTPHVKKTQVVTEVPESIASTSAEIETEIAEQLTPSLKPKPAAPAEFASYHTTQNIALDSSLFKNFATRSIIASEIKKLKIEFEKLNNSSLFQNVDWNQFWDNTKVQKQLEAAFAQLKALEFRQKNNSTYVYASGTGRGKSVRKAEALKLEEMDLRVAASKKLATIINGRILDIKLLQPSVKVVEDLNYHFDLPDFSRLNTKIAVEPYSYSYSEKPKTVVKGSLMPTTPAAPCNEEVQERTKTHYNTERQNFIISEGGILSGKARAVVPKAKVLKVARI